ncbi:MAG: class I SAM-dependent methyltransferase [Salegentibacter sp.]
MSNRSQHWEKIYETKQQEEFSWYQKRPETSLNLIRGMNLPKDAAIIDIGGGDTFLVDFLLADGFSNITVLDVSVKALERAQNRLGEKAETVKWITADISEYISEEKYDVWHDRAALHFLIKEDEVQKYLQNLRNSVKSNGFVILGTFSENGPTRCSGLPIRQYSQQDLKQLLKDSFTPLKCLSEDHITPGGSTQNFNYCSFRKK